MKVTSILRGEVKEKCMLYAFDMEDAISMARLLAKCGYHVQIGPMNEETSGVCVHVWDGRSYYKDKEGADHA